MQTAAAAPLAHSRRHGRNACYPPPQTLVENHDCHGGARSTTIGALHDGHTAPSGTSSAMSRPGASFVSSPAAAAARWRTRQSAWKAQPHWTVYLHAFGDGREGVNCARARRARARARRGGGCASGSALLGRTLHGLAAHRARGHRADAGLGVVLARAAALARHDRHPLREARRRVVLRGRMRVQVHRIGDLGPGIAEVAVPDADVVARVDEVVRLGRLGRRFRSHRRGHGRDDTLETDGLATPNRQIKVSCSLRLPVAAAARVIDRRRPCGHI